MQSNPNPVLDVVYLDMYTYIMEIADVLQSFYYAKLAPANIVIPSRVDLEDIAKTIIVGFISTIDNYGHLDLIKVEEIMMNPEAGLDILDLCGIPNDPATGNPLGYAIEDWCIWRDTLELFINGRFASILLKVYYSLKANRFITDDVATYDGHLVYIATDYIGYNLRFVHALRLHTAPVY